MRAQRLCATPGCSGSSHATYCAACGVGGKPGVRSRAQQTRDLNSRGGSGGKWMRIRLEVFARDNYTCQECGFIGTAEELRCAHLIDGGPAVMTNLRTLCRPCHEAETPHGGG